MASTDWRIFLCDRMGMPLSNLSRVAMNRRFTYRMMRPAQFTFEVPSDDAAVRTDATPILKPGETTVKAWRREAGSSWVLRYAGYVWTLDDEGGPETYKTKVACYDPVQRLATRLCRDVANAVVETVKFSAVEADDIAQQLIDRTNTGGGVSGVKNEATGPTTTAVTATFELRTVAEAILELVGQGGFEFKVTPVDQTDGYLGTFDREVTLGTDKSATVKLGWDSPPNNVVSIERHLDMATVANDLRVYGSGGVTGRKSLVSDATSITALGRYEGASVHADVTLQAYLDSLASTELAFRKNARELVSWKPQGDQGTTLWWAREMMPWDDYDLGDLVTVSAGKKLRGGFSGVQRIYGWTIDLDDDAVERVSEVLTGPDL